jgi:hypothetical protein
VRAQYGSILIFLVSMNIFVNIGTNFSTIIPNCKQIKNSRFCLNKQERF